MSQIYKQDYISGGLLGVIDQPTSGSTGIPANALVLSTDNRVYKNDGSFRTITSTEDFSSQWTLAIDATSKADTDLSNVDSDLSDAEKLAIRTKIGAGTGGGSSHVDGLRVDSGQLRLTEDGVVTGTGVTVDSRSIEDSDNLITSGGVFDSIATRVALIPSAKQTVDGETAFQGSTDFETNGGQKIIDISGSTGDVHFVGDGATENDKAVYIRSTGKLHYDPTNSTSSLTGTDANEIAVKGELSTLADEITAILIERNSAGQTLEQWEDAGNSASTFVADSANSITEVSLANNLNLLANDNYSKMIVATENGNDYHFDLLRFQALNGRLILQTDNLVTRLAAIDTAITEAGMSGGGEINAQATYSQIGVTLAEVSGENRLTFGDSEAVATFVENIGWPLGNQNFEFASGQSFNFEIVEADGTTHSFSAGRIGGTTNFIYDTTDTSLDHISFQTQSLNVTTARTGTIRTNLAEAPVTDIVGGTNVTLGVSDGTLTINAQGGTSTGGGLQVISAFSEITSPTNGQDVYLDTTDGTNRPGIYQYDSATTSWVIVIGGAGVPFGNTLPRVSGTLGELFRLLQADGNYQLGFYVRIANTGAITDWRQLGEERGNGAFPTTNLYDGRTFYLEEHDTSGTNDDTPAWYVYREATAATGTIGTDYQSAIAADWYVSGESIEATRIYPTLGDTTAVVNPDTIENVVHVEQFEVTPGIWTFDGTVYLYNGIAHDIDTTQDLWDNAPLEPTTTDTYRSGWETWDNFVARVEGGNFNPTEYDPTQVYNTGDLVTADGELFQCTATTTAQPGNATIETQGNFFRSITETLASVDSVATFPLLTPSNSIIRVGEIMCVINDPSPYNNGLYRVITHDASGTTVARVDELNDLHQIVEGLVQHGGASASFEFPDDNPAFITGTLVDESLFTTVEGTKSTSIPSLDTVGPKFEPENGRMTLIYSNLSDTQITQLEAAVGSDLAFRTTAGGVVTTGNVEDTNNAVAAQSTYHFLLKSVSYRLGTGRRQLNFVMRDLSQATDFVSAFTFLQNTGITGNANNLYIPTDGPLVTNLIDNISLVTIVAISGGGGGFTNGQIVDLGTGSTVNSVAIATANDLSSFITGVTFGSASGNVDAVAEGDKPNLRWPDTKLPTDVVYDADIANFITTETGIPVFQTTINLVTSPSDLSGNGDTVQMAFRFGAGQNDPVEVYATTDAGSTWAAHTVSSAQTATMFGDILASDQHSVGADTTIHPSPNNELYVQGNGTGQVTMLNIRSVNGIQFDLTQYTSLLIGVGPDEITTTATGYETDGLSYAHNGTTYYRLFASDGLTEILTTNQNNTDTGDIVYTKTY